MTMCLIYIYKNLYVQYIILIILNTNLTKSHINHKSNANRKPPRLWAKCPAHIYKVPFQRYVCRSRILSKLHRDHTTNHLISSARINNTQNDQDPTFRRRVSRISYTTPNRFYHWLLYARALCVILYAYRVAGARILIDSCGLSW